MNRITVPGDKSVSHRALILAALGAGRSRIRGLLRSADIESTADVLRALGVAIPNLAALELVVDGVGLRGLSAPTASLDCGNSGTTARLMAGVVAGAGIHARFVGDASLSARPMRRVAAPLEAMGATITLSSAGTLPMELLGGALRGVTWRPDVASAQVKGAVLLAGLVGGVPVEVHEPAATRDHTERMLRARGVSVVSEGLTVSLQPKGPLAAADVAVPGDPSSAAFFAGLAAIGGAGEGIALESVGVNPGRMGAFQVLERMGARVRYESTRDSAGEPVATLLVGPRELHGTELSSDEIPSLIDELPLLACVAACADGETRVTGAAELRVKESDRIRAIVENLRAVGGHAEELPDGFIVRGSGRPLRGRVVTKGDHRIAMAFAILGAAAGNAIDVDDPSCAGVSYPTFWDELARVRER